MIQYTCDCGRSKLRKGLTKHIVEIEYTTGFEPVVYDFPPQRHRVHRERTELERLIWEDAAEEGVT